MSQQDSPQFRELICRLLPGLAIEEVARPSGQRIVYFGSFASVAPDELEAWDGFDVGEWGKIVVKVSSGITPEAITYLQREIRILRGGPGKSDSGISGFQA